MGRLALAILASLTIAGTGRAASSDVWAASGAQEPKTYGWGVGIDANEIRLRLTGGYGGERLGRVKLRALKRFRVATLYAHASDRHVGATSRLYIDRDRDGVIDAGALYNPKTGIVSVDWSCDGVGDQVLTDLTPPQHDLRWMLEHPNTAS
jgi:hypothetical protein